MGARLNGIQKGAGSNPASSTLFQSLLSRIQRNSTPWQAEWRNWRAVSRRFSGAVLPQPPGVRFAFCSGRSRDPAYRALCPSLSRCILSECSPKNPCSLRAEAAKFLAADICRRAFFSLHHKLSARQFLRLLGVEVKAIEFQMVIQPMLHRITQPPQTQLHHTQTPRLVRSQIIPTALFNTTVIFALLLT